MIGRLGTERDRGKKDLETVEWRGYVEHPRCVFVWRTDDSIKGEGDNDRYVESKQAM